MEEKKEKNYRVIVNHNGANSDFNWKAGEPVELPESIVASFFDRGVCYFVDENGEKIKDPRPKGGE